MNDLTIIELTDSEAKSFIMFRQLEAKGLFEIRNGQGIVHFDHEGNIRKVERHDII